MGKAAQTSHLLLLHTPHTTHAQSFGTTSWGSTMSPNPVLRAPTQQNDLAKVRELLEEGEDVNQADSFAMAPICYAAQNGYKEMVRLLLEHGANPNVENKVKSARYYYHGVTVSFDPAHT